MGAPRDKGFKCGIELDAARHRHADFTGKKRHKHGKSTRERANSGAIFDVSSTLRLHQTPPFWVPQTIKAISSFFKKSFTRPLVVVRI
jgi:hypothetical protein